MYDRIERIWILGVCVNSLWIECIYSFFFSLLFFAFYCNLYFFFFFSLGLCNTHFLATLLVRRVSNEFFVVFFLRNTHWNGSRALLRQWTVHSNGMRNAVSNSRIWEKIIRLHGIVRFEHFGLPAADKIISGDWILFIECGYRKFVGNCSTRIFAMKV